MNLARINFRVFAILIILANYYIAPTEEKGTPEVPLAAAGAGTLVHDVAVGAHPDATPLPMQRADDAVVPEVVPAKDEDGALDRVSPSGTRRLAVDAGKTDRDARWTVSSTSCCS